MQIEDVKRVLILGAGTMGHQIGLLCATHGFETVLYDIDQKALDKAGQRMERLSKNFVATGRISQEQADKALSLISLTTSPEQAADDVDFVSESVPEDPKLKGKIFGQFSALCPERAVFTTNTSTLIPSMFAEASGRPDKLCALHFHDVRLTNVVDIMPHPGTSQYTVELVSAFAKKIGQVTIVLKRENFGYVFNVMLSEWFKSAQSLAANGVASPKDIDRAWMGVMHSPVGPFGVMDSVGLDTVWKITDYWAKALNDAQAMKNAAFLKEFVDSGRMGTKTGQGIYSYPNPQFARPGFVEGEGPDD
ncbi:MAG: 3-hydroxyacyl-CoA dehydrogenase [Desulfatibacillaceae bacterium]|nr:3-hydroxyacyl-CoA dehydrogenase [Desulfatibacillaceae bacterium]